MDVSTAYECPYRQLVQRYYLGWVAADWHYYHNSPSVQLRVTTDIQYTCCNYYSSLYSADSILEHNE